MSIKSFEVQISAWHELMLLSFCALISNQGVDKGRKMDCDKNEAHKNNNWVPHQFVKNQLVKCQLIKNPYAFVSAPKMSNLRQAA